jgi:hypothetical protein
VLFKNWSVFPDCLTGGNTDVFSYPKKVRNELLINSGQFRDFRFPFLPAVTGCLGTVPCDACPHLQSLRVDRFCTPVPAHRVVVDGLLASALCPADLGCCASGISLSKNTMTDTVYLSQIYKSQQIIVLIIFTIYFIANCDSNSVYGKYANNELSK